MRPPEVNEGCPEKGMSVTVAAPACRCADFVLLNKVDMLQEGQLEGLTQIAASLNPLAKVPPNPDVLKCHRPCMPIPLLVKWWPSQLTSRRAVNQAAAYNKSSHVRRLASAWLRWCAPEADGFLQP